MEEQKKFGNVNLGLLEEAIRLLDPSLTVEKETGGKTANPESISPPIQENPALLSNREQAAEVGLLPPFALSRPIKKEAPPVGEASGEQQRTLSTISVVTNEDINRVKLRSRETKTRGVVARFFERLRL